MCNFITLLLLLTSHDPAAGQPFPRRVPGFPNAGPQASQLLAAADSLKGEGRRLDERATLISTQADRVSANTAPMLVAASLNDEAARLQAESNRFRTEATQRRGQIQAYEAVLGEVEARIDELRTALVMLQDGLDALPPFAGDSLVDVSDVERESLAHELRGTREEVGRAEGEVQRIQQTIESLRAEIGRLEERALRLDGEATSKMHAAASLLAGNTAGAADELRNEARNIEAEAARLRARASSLEAQAANLNMLLRRRILPARSADDAKAFHDEYASVNFGKNANLSMGRILAPGTAAVEVASAYLGPVRFAATGIVAWVDTDSSMTAVQAREEAARQRFYAGGGSFTTAAAIPLVFGREGPLTGVVQARIGLALDDAPTADAVPAAFEIATDSYINVADSADGSLRLFGMLHAGVLWGNSIYFESIGHYPGERVEYLSVALGLEFANGVRLLLTGVKGPVSLRDNFRFAIQVAPGGNPER